MMLQQFIDQQTNNLASLDGVPDNAGQSPQLAALWCRFLGLPFQWANAYDWWDESDDTFAVHWKKVERPQASDELPMPGDIVVFSDSLPGSDGYGHLSIFVEGEAGSSGWTGFDANWGGKSSHLQSHNWAYVIGWFTPVNRSVLEASIPTPIAVPTASDPFEMQPIEPQMVTIKNDQAPLYNLNIVSWDSFSVDSTSHVGVGEQVAVVAVAKHRLGGTFLMSDIDRAEGYDVNDCESYNDSPPRIPEIPGMDDADDMGDPPERQAGVNIAAPISAPSTTDIVQVIEPIPRYRHLSDAVAGKNSVGQFNPNRYHVYNRLNGMINLTQELGQSGWWINPEDLKRREKTDWHNLELFSKPRYFKATQSVPIVDLDGWQPGLSIKGGQTILIAGFFRGPDQRVYAAPQITYGAPDRKWYGVDKEFLVPFDDIPRPAPEPEPEFEQPFTLRDRLYSLMDNVIAYFKGSK